VLAPLSQVGPLVGRKDRRAVLAALADLGVPVVKIRSRYYADPGDVADAVAARSAAPRRRARPASVTLRPGERLWH
jgi:hypothetical protein